jgi:SAM-dependent methyltransferase
MNWWERNLPNRMGEFLGWLGGPDAASRVVARKMIGDCDSILDVACGPGVEFTRWGDRWTGCDTCKALIDHAAKNGITVEYGDAEDLPYEDGSYEVVYARHVWEHLPTFKKALAEAMRVARRKVVHVFFRPPAQTQLLGMVDGEHENIYARKDIERAIKKLDPNAEIRWKPVGSEEVLMITKGVSDGSKVGVPDSAGIQGEAVDSDVLPERPPSGNRGRSVQKPRKRVPAGVG